MNQQYSVGKKQLNRDLIKVEDAENNVLTLKNLKTREQFGISINRQ